MRKNDCVPVGNTDMYYVSFGDGEKTLVVLPGLSDGLATVQGKAAVLSVPYKKYLHEYTVYMFSRKNAMPEGYTIREMAEDQALAMGQLGLHRAFVLGVSQGGMIAQCLAIYHPEMVAGLILAVTAPDANKTVKEVVSGWIDLAKRGDHTALMMDTFEKVYSDKYIQKNRRYIPLIARFTKPSGYDRFLINARAILAFDVRSELKRISCPTLIIAGSKDRTLGKEAALTLHRDINGSELYVYEGLGHGAYEEAKDFYARVFAFCEASCISQEREGK